MKTVIILGCVLLSGCTGGDEKEYRYRFSNQSGHRVAVVVDELDHALPDSLAIDDGATYEWVNLAQIKGFFPLRTTREIKVYYGDDVKAVLLPQHARSPIYTDNYTLYRLEKGSYLAVYTFTVGDYEAAVKESIQPDVFQPLSGSR